MRSDPLDRHALPRWQTRFGRWIGDVGVKTIVKELGAHPEARVTRTAVAGWLAGHAPRPARALALVELSERLNRPISIEAIYSHRFELEDLRRQESAGSRDG